MRVVKYWMLLLGALGVTAAPTPLDEPLKPGQEMMIEAHEPNGPIPAITTFNDPNNTNRRSGFHYRLWVPKDYNDNPNKKYPVLFIQSPGGNARMVGMGPRLQRDGWIVAMLVEASNKCDDSINCFLAVHDDVIKRCRVAQGLKFITGMSGGARNTSLFALLRPGVRGIFMQAAGFVWGMDEPLRYDHYPKHIFVANSFGNRDCNKKEFKNFVRKLPDLSRYRLFSFKGGHTWINTEAFEQAMDWMEQKVFLEKPRAIESIPTLNGILPEIDKEPMNHEAYLWYLELLQKRMDATDDLYQKYKLAGDMVTVIENGRLDRKGFYKKQIRKFKNMQAGLLRNPQVKGESRAARVMAEIEEAELKLYQDLIPNLDELKHKEQKEWSDPCEFIPVESVTQVVKNYQELADKFIGAFSKSQYKATVKNRLINLGLALDYPDIIPANE